MLHDVDSWCSIIYKKKAYHALTIVCNPDPVGCEKEKLENSAVFYKRNQLGNIGKAELFHDIFPVSTYRVFGNM